MWNFLPTREKIRNTGNHRTFPRPIVATHIQTKNRLFQIIQIIGTLTQASTKSSAIEQISSFFRKLTQTTKTHYSHKLRIANFFFSQTQFAFLLMIITNQNHSIFLHYFAFFLRNHRKFIFRKQQYRHLSTKKTQTTWRSFWEKTYSVEQKNQKKKQERTRPKRPKLLTKKQSKTRWITITYL